MLGLINQVLQCRSRVFEVVRFEVEGLEEEVARTQMLGGAKFLA